MQRFGLRLDDDLYDKARAAAKEQERSLNWWLTDLVRKALTPPPQPEEQA